MILYFTGTGNSRYVANRLGAALSDEVVPIHPYIRSKTPGAFTSQKPYVFVMPTYAWRMPRIVSAFLEGASLSGSRDAYFVLTCGDGAGNAAAGAKRLCRQKGLTFRGLLPVVMPENYIAMFPVPEAEEAQRIIAAAEPAIDAAADEIRRGGTLPARRAGLLDRLLSGVVNPVFYAAIVHDRGFCATGACTGCGRCAALCPLENIRLRDGRPVWNGNCTHCMACICACPAGAIEYGKASRGKPRYYLDDGSSGRK